MSCPTCDHTMQSLQDAYWCPRCGTLKGKDATFEETDVPKLVERCREFEAQFEDVPTPGPGRETWHRLGIAESIHRPDDRPQGGH